MQLGVSTVTKALADTQTSIAKSIVDNPAMFVVGLMGGATALKGALAGLPKIAVGPTTLGLDDVVHVGLGLLMSQQNKVSALKAAGGGVLFSWVYTKAAGIFGVSNLPLAKEAYMANANARPGFSQAWTFNKGQNANSNMQWPNLNSIGALSNYVDASYPDINSIPYAGNASANAKDQALNQTLPYLQWRGMSAQQQETSKVDFMGQNNGGNDNGYYAHNNPFQGQALASFSRMSTSE